MPVLIAISNKDAKRVVRILAVEQNGGAGNVVCKLTELGPGETRDFTLSLGRQLNLEEAEAGD